MSTRMTALALAAATAAVMLLHEPRPARALTNQMALGVEFMVEPPTGTASAFDCAFAVRSLVSGERIILEKFTAVPGKETTKRKEIQGHEMEARVTVAADGSEVTYTTQVGQTGSAGSLVIHSARVKLRK